MKISSANFEKWKSGYLKHTLLTPNMAVTDVIPRIILQDIFYSYPLLTGPYELSLSQKILFIKNSLKSRSDSEDIMVQDIIGCHILQGKEEKSKSDGKGDIGAYLCIYSYPLRSGGLLSKQPRRERHAVTFQMRKCFTRSENIATVQKWRTAILWLLRGKILLDEGVPKIPTEIPLIQKLLVIVNPHSGPGKAAQIFRERVVPLLAESDMQYKLLITDRANCARDFVKKSDLTEFSGIVVVSGDGLLFEVINGLMKRPDWQTAIKVPVGIIPGGSGNGLASAINYACGEPFDTTVVTSSVLNIVRGRVAPMDLVQVHTSSGPIYSFLSVGWGLIADIDVESEKLRAIGEARFSLWAVIRALGLRKYKGKLSYLPVASYESSTCIKSLRPVDMKRSKTTGGEWLWSVDSSSYEINSSDKNLITRSKSFGTEKLDSCDKDNGVRLVKFSYNDEFITSDCEKDSLHDHTNGVNGNDCAAASHDCTPDEHDSVSSDSEKGNLNSIERPPTMCTPLDQAVPDDWIVIEDEFVLVYVACQTHLSSDVLFAPNAKLDDGLMWLVIIRAGVSRAQVIYFLSSMQNGDHVHIPYVDVIPIHAFRLEPFQADGILTVDGEVIPSGSIQAEVLPSMARVMTR